MVALAVTVEIDKTMFQDFQVSKAIVRETRLITHSWSSRKLLYFFFKIMRELHETNKVGVALCNVRSSDVNRTKLLPLRMKLHCSFNNFV